MDQTEKIDLLVDTVTRLACLLDNMVVLSDEYSESFKHLVATDLDDVFIDLEKIKG